MGMNKFVKFFHEIMNPHCEHCEHDRLEAHHCKTCEVLSVELSIANNRIGNLLEKIGKTEETTAPVDNTTRQVIQTRHVPWGVKRQMLEAESRTKLANMAKPDEPPKTVTESVQNLEKELGIPNGTAKQSIHATN